MNKKQIKELLKAHCAIENGRWVFKKVDIDAASLELEQALRQNDVIRSVCKCGNQLTEKELFYETCLQCNDVVIAN